jgi:hypothetical protein
MSNLSKALKAAKYGPEAKNLNIKGHDFNVKKYSRLLGMETIIHGQISHCLAMRPDDQIYYQVHLSKQGGLKFIKVKIEEGGLTNLLAPAVTVIGSYYTGVPIPEAVVEAIGRKMGEAVDGKGWRQVASYLIGEIALRM